jgi:hypothetical protein
MRSTFSTFSTRGVYLENNASAPDESDEEELLWGADVTKLMREALSGTSYDLAKLVHMIHRDKYRVARLKSKSWYVHDGLKWKPTEVGPYFELSTSILRLFERFFDIQRSRLRPESEEAEDPEVLRKNTDLRQIMLETQKVILKLKNVNTKETVCKECVYMFYDPEFLTKLDVDPNIICFNNGVLNIALNEFQYGSSEYMVSLNIDMDFAPPHNTKESNEIYRVIDCFQTFRLSIVNKRRNRYVFASSSPSS